MVRALFFPAQPAVCTPAAAAACSRPRACSHLSVCWWLWHVLVRGSRVCVCLCCSGMRDATKQSQNQEWPSLFTYLGGSAMHVRCVGPHARGVWLWALSAARRRCFDSARFASCLCRNRWKIQCLVCPQNFRYQQTGGGKTSGAPNYYSMSTYRDSTQRESVAGWRRAERGRRRRDFG